MSVDDKVLTYKSSGKRISSFDTGVTGDFGLVVGDGGRIYLSDFSGNAVHAYTASGEYEGSFTETGGGPFAPWGLEIRPSDGQLWIANATGHKIERVDPAGATIGGPGSGNGLFDTPVDVGFGSKSMYVADRENHRIQRFKAGSGDFQTAWGQHGVRRGQFSSPLSVDIGIGGVVLVLDSRGAADGELEAFRPGGGFLRQSKIPASQVFSLATDKRGDVYVTGLLDYPNGGWGVVRLSPSGVGKAKLAATRVDADKARKKAAVRLRCAKGRACSGSVRVTRGGATLAMGRYRVNSGARGTAQIRLTDKGRKALKKQSSAKVSIRLTTGQGATTRKGKLTR